MRNKKILKEDSLNKNNKKEGEMAKKKKCKKTKSGRCKKKPGPKKKSSKGKVGRLKWR